LVKKREGGVEKKNDDMRRYFHQKCNRWDSCIQILLVEKREEVLVDFSRRKPLYDKRDTNFW